MSGKRIKKALTKFDSLFPSEEKIEVHGRDLHYLEHVVYRTSQIPPGKLYTQETDEPTFTIPDLTLGTQNGGGLAEAPNEDGLRKQWTAYELLMFYRGAGKNDPHEYAPRVQEHILQNTDAEDRPIASIVTLLTVLKRCWAIEGIGKLETAIATGNLAQAEDAFARLHDSDMESVRNYALDKMAAYRRSQRESAAETRIHK